MQRILGKTLSLASLILLGAAAMPACTDEDGMIFVRGNLRPPQTRTNGCVYLPDPQGEYQSGGTMDVALTNTYGMNLVVGNQLIARGDSTAPRAETNRVHFEGAVVRVTDTNQVVINEFTSLTTGFAEASTSNTPGYGVANFSAMDAETVRRVNLTKLGDTKLVLAHVKVFGKTLGGVDVETAEWTYPIQLGYGNLVAFQSDTSQPTPNCLGAPPTGDVVDPCAIGQDETILCSKCAGVAACAGATP